MTDQLYVYGTAALIVGLVLSQVFTKGFDPFAPVWLFLVGYLQVYVVQAISYHDWALRVRGPDLVASANLRALWALIWFLVVYYSRLSRPLARRLPAPPEAWSSRLVAGLSPFLVLWGLICAGVVLRGGVTEGDSVTGVSDGEAILRSFPAVMLVGAILLVVTGRTQGQSRHSHLFAGLLASAGYTVIWMFNGKRSHSLLGVLATLSAFYIARGKRPSLPILATTAVVGVMVVAIAIGWRGNNHYDRGFGGFLKYLTEFDPSTALVSLNIKHREVEWDKPVTHETEEYGGFLLMMDTVPRKSGFDFGAPYFRVITTFIPRAVWPGKPLPGRDKWIAAWQAGSEMPREPNFTGPAIGILGAAQLNGGAWGTLAVMGCAALLLRTAYDYFRLHSHCPWVQAWWALTYYNAWFMTVADDPLNWYYYNYGFTTLPWLLMMFVFNRLAGRAELSYRHCYAVAA